MRFYFAWVNKTDTTFSETFAREDEEVFALNISQSEGDFASAEIDLINPRIGLLAPSRKQWAWISYRDDVGALHVLFFGRLISVPQSLQANIIRLTFIARPGDFEEQKAALAETLKSFPYWDPLFFSDQDQADPDKVLEGRSSLWHIDRLTGEVTISDIITGEDGQIDYTGDDIFYDSVNVSYSASPARKCIVQATVGWNQTGGGEIDVTQLLLNAYEAAGQPAGLYSVSDQLRASAGMVNIVNGDVFIKAWPQFGASIGGGWQVGDSFAKVVGDPPLDPIFVTGKTPFDISGWNAAWEAIQNWEEFPHFRGQIQSAFDRSPGFVIGIIDHTHPLPNINGYWIGREFVHGAIDVLWVPIWQVAIGMKLQWETARDRTETALFEIDADVQPLLTDRGEDEVVRLTIDGANADNFIGDVRRNRYFATDRGRQSLEHLIARARAALLARARAIDVSFQVEFDRGVALTLRKSASMIDPRLPGGVAAGKIKAYSLVAQGDGAVFASVTIGCSVGRDGSITPDDGNPDYVEEGYVEPAYQEYEGGLVVPIAGDVGYTLEADYAIFDDGVNLAQVDPKDYLLNITVEGGLSEQMAATQYTHPQNPQTAPLVGSSVEAATLIANVVTTTKLVMRPVTGGPFNSPVYPTLTTLKIPRTIDLENAAPKHFTFHGAMRKMGANIEVTLAPTLVVTGHMPKMGAAINVALHPAIQVHGSMAKMGASIHVQQDQRLAVDGDMPAMRGSINLLETDTLTIEGALAPMSGAIDMASAIIHVTGQMGAMTGALVVDPIEALLVNGLMGSMSGSLDMTHELVAVTGTLGAMGAELNVLDKDGVAVTGSLPAMSGSLDMTHELITLAGALPAMSGSLDMTHELVAISGTLPAMSGVANIKNKNVITIAGAMTKMTSAVAVSNKDGVTLSGTMTKMGASASVTITPPGLTVDYLIAGNGGSTGAASGGGFDGGASGGAGAGEYVTGASVLLSSGTYPIVIGAVATAALPNTAGGNNTFNGKTAKAGGNGRGSTGQAGGSASGGGIDPAAGGFAGGTANNSDGAGHNGAAAASSSGGGGGATAAGSGATGGAGTTWLDGNTYCKGGNGHAQTTAVGTVGTNPGDGSNGAGHAIGAGSSAGADGKLGKVVIRYSDAGGQIATGGTVTHVGAFYYHTFTASGNFVVP